MIQRKLTEAEVVQLTKITAFLVWAEKDNPNMMYGSHKIGDVINAVSDFFGWPRHVIREGYLLEPEKPGDDRHD